MAMPLQLAAACTHPSLDSKTPQLLDQLPLAGKDYVHAAISFNDQTHRKYLSLLLEPIRFRNGSFLLGYTDGFNTRAQREALTLELSFYESDRHAVLFPSTVRLVPRYEALDETLAKHEPNYRRILSRAMRSKKPHSLFAQMNRLCSLVLKEEEVYAPQKIGNEYMPTLSAEVVGRRNTTAHALTRYQINQLLHERSPLSYAHVVECCAQLNELRLSKRRSA